MRLGLLGLFENCEADIRFRFGQVVESETGEGTAKKEASVFRVLFDHLGDRLFGLGEVLIEDGLFGRGYGWIKKCIFVGPLCQRADVRKTSGSMG